MIRKSSLLTSQLASAWCLLVQACTRVCLSTDSFAWATSSLIAQRCQWPGFSLFTRRLDASLMRYFVTTSALPYTILLQETQRVVNSLIQTNGDRNSHRNVPWLEQPSKWAAILPGRNRPIPLRAEADDRTGISAQSIDHIVAFPRAHSRTYLNY